MKTLYLECNMGAAGDMLMAALMELLPDKQAFVARMNALGIPGVRLAAEPACKCGITGTHAVVTVYGAEEGAYEHDHAHDHAHEHAHEHDHGHAHDHDREHEHEHDHEHDHAHDHDHEHEHAHDHEREHDHEHDHEHAHAHEHDHAHHAHAGLQEITQILAGLELSPAVRANALQVYGRIAEAESAVHGRPVEQVHFHEVGALDAVADVVGVCLLMETLAPERIVASPVHVGCGTVRCAHGILPVPAPATARILRGVPCYGGTVQGELCTPTGAALLAQFAAEFGGMPLMRVEKIGYGMGGRDFATANCLRAFLGESDEDGDGVTELCCNLDDMTPEAVGFAQEQLFACGALDVYTIPIGMKKSRPGVLLCCLCRAPAREAALKTLFKHTTTLGVREYACKRTVLARTERTADTQYGPVRIKTASGWGVAREKIEYEDAARIARERDLPLSAIYERPKEK